jgi:hypothetical protein
LHHFQLLAVVAAAAAAFSFLFLDNDALTCMQAVHSLQAVWHSSI